MKFKVGDRVSLRGYSYFGFNTDGLKGRVVVIDEGGDLGVRVDGDNGAAVAIRPSQCHKLVKKPRRRVYVNLYMLSHTAHDTKEEAVECSSSYTALRTAVEFVEVKRRKK